MHEPIDPDMTVEEAARDLYRKLELENSTIIYDGDNPDAWIESTYTIEIG